MNGCMYIFLFLELIFKINLLFSFPSISDHDNRIQIQTCKIVNKILVRAFEHNFCPGGQEFHQLIFKS